MKILLTIIVFIPFILKGQSWDLSQQELVERFSEFRSKVILENKQSVNNLRLLEEKWGEIDVNSEAFRDMIFDVIFNKHMFDLPNNVVLKIVSKRYPQYELKNKISEEDIEIIGENNEILDLILNDVLKPEFPYILNKNTSLFEELIFYKINHNDKIGEIGAGDGIFSLLVGVLNKNVEITINEISKRKFKYIGKKIDENADFLEISKLSLVKGEKKTINFTENEYDKIIIRNSFHHFARKKQMLESIKRSLKSNGALFLNEPIISLVPKDKLCGKVMEKEKLIQVIEENGFQLKKMEQSGTRLLMKFTIKN